MIEVAGLYVLAYLLGGVPTAFVLAKLVKGVDIRGYGSGNVGGSNVFYHVGKRWGVLVGVLEIVVKGALPVYVGHYALGLDRSSPLLLGVPLLAVAGHNWSPYLKLQGGRGVGVVVGTLFAMSPWLFVAFMAVGLPGWAVTRSMGVWVLISLTLLPVWAVLLAVLHDEPTMLSFYCLGLLGLVVAKRLLSNWTPFPEGSRKRRVLFNRLFRDRDVDDRAEWVHRIPTGTE